MAALAGRDVRIQIATTDVAGARADEITINREHIDITDKDDDGIRTLLDEIGTWAMTMTCSGVLKNDALADWAEDPTEVLKAMSVVIAGIGTYSGSFGMSNFQASGGSEGAEAATFTATFESSGTITFTPA